MDRGQGLLEEAMKTFIAAVAMGWLLIWCAEPALAQGCTTQTIFMPDGRVLFCQTCGSVTTCL